MPSEADTKQAVRERVWSRLAQDQASPDPYGRIPDFEGAVAAAERLTELQAWKRAGVVKANPDQPQLPVRIQALHDDKLVYMAVPKLADPLPFFRLDPTELGDDAAPLAAHRAAARRAPKTALADMRRSTWSSAAVWRSTGEGCASAREPATPTSRSAY